MNTKASVDSGITGHDQLFPVLQQHLWAIIFSICCINRKYSGAYSKNQGAELRITDGVVEGVLVCQSELFS